MPVKVFCPNPKCNASYSIATGDVGRKGRCRECGTQFEMNAESSWGAALDGPVLLGAADPPKDVPGALGSQFGRYKILRKLGQGGMGAVYLAHDEKLERPIALKMPHFDLGSGPEVVGRFLREARAAAAFHHPNFCPIYDVGEIEGSQFLAMAYIEGQTLGSVIERDRPMAPPRAAEIARQLALALAEAHRRGIVHRDLKPSNVMIDARGTLIIMDFGVARRTGTEDVEWTKSGALLGTPHYMSPEQVRGEKQATGPAIDIYALGVILYQLLAGRRPFEGPVSLVLGLIAVQEPEPPSAYRPDLDRGLEAICLKAMAKRIEDRYRSMEAFAKALEGFLARLGPAKEPESWPVTATPSSLPAYVPPPGRSRLGPVLATAAILLGAVGLAGFVLVQQGVIQVGAAKPPAPGATMPVELAKANAPARPVEVAANTSAPVPVATPPAATPTPPPTAPLMTSPGPPTTPPAREVPPPPPAPDPAPAPRPTPPARDFRKEALEAARRGVALMGSKDFAKALDEFDEAIRLDPEQADSYYRRAVIHESQGRPDRAIDDASDAVRIKPDHADALDLRARAWIARKEFDKAIADLDRAIAVDPRHADALDNRGAVYLARKDYDKAIVDFRHAINLEGDHPRAFLNRGRAYQGKGDHDRAIADFTEAIDNLDDEKTPDDARRASARLGRGTSHLEQKDYEKAVLDLEEAIRLDPKLADAYVNLGRADLAKKDYDKAIANFRKAVRLEKDHARAYMDLGLAYDAKGDHPNAIANFTRAIDVDPARAEAYLERGESRLALKDHARAIDDCDAAIRLDPRLADAYDVRGIARYDRQDYDQAIADFTSATQLDSKHPNAFEGRGLAHLAKKEFGPAIASFDEALRVDPDDTTANSVLATILASCPDDQFRDGQKALALATRACDRLRWRDAYALNALAEAHAELGQFPQAVRRQSEAIDLIPDEPTRQNYRTRLQLYEQGRPYRSPR